MDFPAGRNDFDERFRIPSVGDEVAVIQGPFESFDGTVVEVDWSQSLAIVEINIFGKPIDVSLRLRDIKKTKPG